jgi:hypothetical protein
MIRVLLSAAVCFQLGHSSRFTWRPEIWERARSDPSGKIGPYFRIRDTSGIKDKHVVPYDGEKAILCHKK